MNRISWRVGGLLALLPFVTLGTAFGADAPQKAPAAVMEQPALDLLKGMSDKLAAAKSISFHVRDYIEAPGGTGQFLIFFAESDVALIRPDKLSVKVGGDAPPFDFAFDGKSMSVYSKNEKLYASVEAPKTIDEMLPFAAKAGILLPFEDVLFSDPYGILTKGITSAFYAGTSAIGGAHCDHVAVAAPGIEWQMWIDTETKLPRLMMGSITEVQGAPRFAVEFSDWKLDPKLAPESFTLTQPADASKMEFDVHPGK